MRKLTNMTLGSVSDLILKDVSALELLEIGGFKIKRTKGIYGLLIEYSKIKVELISLNNLDYNSREIMLKTVNDYLAKNQLYATEVDYSPSNMFSKASIKGKIHKISREEDFEKIRFLSKPSVYKS